MRAAASANEAERQLTLREAATPLAAFRSRLEQLLEQGQIPFPGDGSHRRVRRVDIAANGMVEGNNRFQVAWLPDEKRDHYLERVRALAENRRYRPRNRRSSSRATRRPSSRRTARSGT